MQQPAEAAFLVRATLQVHTATIACPEPRQGFSVPRRSASTVFCRACSIDILDVISSFSWISRFMLLPYFRAVLQAVMRVDM